jgi:hypothetical protein
MRVPRSQVLLQGFHVLGFAAAMAGASAQFEKAFGLDVIARIRKST